MPKPPWPAASQVMRHNLLILIGLHIFCVFGRYSCSCESTEQNKIDEITYSGKGLMNLKF